MLIRQLKRKNKDKKLHWNHATVGECERIISLIFNNLLHILARAKTCTRKENIPIKEADHKAFYSS